SHNPDLARDFDRDLLKRRDLRMVTAHTIEELVEKLRAGADICFVDRVLPDGDCEMALAAIRSDKKLQSVPVVLVAAQGAPPGQRRRARDLGFAEGVERPAARGALGLVVARLLGMPLREDERFAVRVHVFDAEGVSASTADAYLGTSADLSERG